MGKTEQLYFQCPTCHNRSYNDKDIKERYCNKCHKFCGEQTMPDGRPLMAWENEIKIRRSEALTVKNKARELEELFNIFKFSVEHWEDFCNNQLHFFVRADSALLKDFKDNPDKYFSIVREVKDEST